VFLLGSNGPITIDTAALQAKLESPAYARVAESLREVGMGSVQAILQTYAGDDSGLRPWLANAQINLDGNLRLQYLAGLALNLSQEGNIYQDMLRYRTRPEWIH
jgi:spermidine synthase